MTKNEIENPVYDTRNIRITRICVVILLIICAVMLVRGPWLTAAFVRGLHSRDFLLSDKPYAFGVTITIGYICGTLALVMLIMMFRFLGRLAQGNVFTRQNVQTLYLGEDDVEFLRGKRVLIVDDVISTGESLAALEALMKACEANVVGKACVLAEGAAKDRDDIIFLEPLPLFIK